MDTKLQNVQVKVVVTLNRISVYFKNSIGRGKIFAFKNQKVAFKREKMSNSTVNLKKTSL